MLDAISSLEYVCLVKNTQMIVRFKTPVHNDPSQSTTPSTSSIDTHTATVLRIEWQLHLDSIDIYEVSNEDHTSTGIHRCASGDNRDGSIEWMTGKMQAWGKHLGFIHAGDDRVLQHSRVMYHFFIALIRISANIELHPIQQKRLRWKCESGCGYKLPWATRHDDDDDKSDWNESEELRAFNALSDKHAK
jgi:hypothetical protein